MSLIIVDERIPLTALAKLSQFGELLLFKTEKITYPAISGHPDIFMTIVDNNLILAPNTPLGFVNQLKQHQIPFVFGVKHVGAKYPETASYNVVIDEHLILHDFQYTDSRILDYTNKLARVKVKQGYCRCNCISLNGKAYICSDRTIEKKLKDAGKKVMYVDPQGILLPGFHYGFIGGAAGVYKDILVMNGSLRYYNWGDEIKQFAEMAGFSVVELYDGPLFDGGSVFFLHS